VGNLAEAMRAEAAAFLRAAPPAARVPFADDAMRRWIEYRPNPRPGACLADLDRPTRKAAHRLLATALQPHAFAQAMTIISLEEVLDRKEGYRRGRHSDDYYVVVFGDPATDRRWGWRFEGHHVSVTMTLDGDTVFPTPVFFGANPNATFYGEHPVVRPLALEEDLGFEVVRSLPAAVRERAVVGAGAPADIYSGPRGRTAQILPRGVAVAELPSAVASLVVALFQVYEHRLTLALDVDPAALHFAWQGATEPGTGGHYYRIQGPDLLIEYDNTDNGANHAHTVLRRPHTDFGGDVLGAHLSGRPDSPNSPHTGT
jgi:hypothetical protein